MVCQHKFFYAEYFYLFAVFSLFYYYFHHRFYFTTYFNKSPAFAGLFRQSDTKAIPFSEMAFVFTLLPFRGCIFSAISCLPSA